MKYKKNTSGIPQIGYGARTTKRKMERRRRRRRRVIGLILTAVIVFGIWQVVSFLTSRRDPLEDGVTVIGENNAADERDISDGRDTSDGIDTSDGRDTSDENDILSRLEALVRENSEIEEIVRNADAYPVSLLELLADNQETLGFIQNYPNRNSGAESSGLTQDDLTGEIPLLLQWDKRWGYNEYGDDMLAITGCGPTSLSMVIVGLTGDLSVDPGAVAAFSQSHGYCIDDNGTDWRLMTSGAESYGLTATELPLWENSIIKQVQSGHPVICILGPGVFTTIGHFIVIYGYENGEFLVNDPNSIERSEQRWTYESFESQVRNLWAYSIK